MSALNISEFSVLPNQIIALIIFAGTVAYGTDQSDYLFKIKSKVSKTYNI